MKKQDIYKVTSSLKDQATFFVMAATFDKAAKKAVRLVEEKDREALVFSVSLERLSVLEDDQPTLE